MNKNQATEQPTLPTSTPSNDPKTWLRVADGIWQHTSSGIYYERPTIDGSPTYRSLKTRDFEEAQKKYYRRRAKGEAAYQKAPMTTVGEVILNYQEAGSDVNPADADQGHSTPSDVNHADADQGGHEDGGGRDGGSSDAGGSL